MEEHSGWSVAVIVSRSEGELPDEALALIGCPGVLRLRGAALRLPRCSQDDSCLVMLLGLGYH